MTTQFISRVERDITRNTEQYNSVGPGEYQPPSAFSAALPGFAPFSSTSKRIGPGEDKKFSGVAPGSYNISEDPTKKPSVTSVFKSTAKRFETKSADNDQGPGGDYTLPSSFNIKKPTAYPKPTTNPLALIPPRSSSPPSIPAKTQSHGYEVLANGTVRPQGPAVPGYTGRPGDTVGPGDYDPKVEVKFRSQPKPVFPKAPDRSALDKILQKASGAPGPGYYDTPGTFDLTTTGQHLHDSDFLVHLNNAKKRQTSCFESKTTRDAFLKEVERKKYDPGPGQYSLPQAIAQPSPKPLSLQNFSSSGPRFQEEQQRSMRINIPPGKYSIPSEFDQLKLKVMKQKKLVSRSEWAQHIAFVSTEKRFNSESYDNDVPPATAYRPKTGLADTLPKPNVRAGPFGSTETRFKAEKKPEELLTKDQLLQQELNREIQSLLAPKPASSPEPYNPNAQYQRPMAHSMLSSPIIRPRYSSSFAPTPENRLRPIKSPPGPPPGAYDVRPKWDQVAGIVPMAPPVVLKKKKPETLPGPGQYALSRDLVKSQPRNPKQIMMSTTKRDPFKLSNEKLVAPGPGRYDVSGSLLRPSHNILLASSDR